MSTGYVFGWLVAMILDNILPMEVGDPIEQARAARKAKGLVVPLKSKPSDAQAMLQEGQLANPKEFESDSAHHEGVVVPVGAFFFFFSAVQIVPLLRAC